MDQGAEKGPPGDRSCVNKGKCPHWGWWGGWLPRAKESSWRAVDGKDSSVSLSQMKKRHKLQEETLVVDATSREVFSRR